MGHYWTEMMPETEEDRRQEQRKKDDAEYERAIEESIKEQCKKIPKENSNNPLAYLFVRAEVLAYKSYDNSKIYSPQSRAKTKTKKRK
ncbi:MAG: hypothetical protein KA007_03015 [Candidatus Pacebacteria bacterium]|jgi:hypothetical protein|nr:hypothetical protein [Candidatus Paceibacterota bacterium]